MEKEIKRERNVDTKVEDFEDAAMQIRKTGTQKEG